MFTIWVSLLTETKKEQIIASLVKEGTPIVQAAERPGLSYAFLDIEKKGGGVFFELIEKLPI